MELMNSDFYKSIGEYYAENPSPNVKIVEKSSGASAWKLPEDKMFARKNGIYLDICMMRQGRRGKVKGVVLEMGSLRGEKNGFFPTWCFVGWVF